ncbi:MAG: 2TM domain-containing protein [Leptolyngbyaceae bacterium]|nr:2TM domain-containing protein [Leptolyngbyaceae bacterium]
MPKLYSSEEVQEILNLAIARQAKAGELTRQQLFEIADELGLSAQDIQRAEDEWQLMRNDPRDREDFCRYRKVQFRQHAIRYALVGGFTLISFGLLFQIGTPIWLFLMLAVGPGIFFFVWTLVLLLDGLSALQTEGEHFERRYELWKRKQLLKRSVNRFVGRSSRVVGGLFERWFEAT